MAVGACQEDREIEHVIKDQEVTRKFKNEKLQEHFRNHSQQTFVGLEDVFNTSSA